MARLAMLLLLLATALGLASDRAQDGPSACLPRPSGPADTTGLGTPQNGIGIDVFGVDSMAGLVSSSDLVLIGRATEVVAPLSPGGHVFIVRIEVDEVLSGRLWPCADIGLIQSPAWSDVVGVGTRYLLFLRENPFYPGSYNIVGGPEQGTWLVDDDGVVQSSMGAKRALGWQAGLLRRPIDEVMVKLRWLADQR
ncbi:MAG: hypothetical protein JWN20_2139 [Jatrophihabitantaceae bacterium]|nr:hypothetical protein [Jatrophihabitantaceae bacterium]